MAVTVTTIPNEVSSSDRLSFTLFIAIILHSLVIFGVTFELGQPDLSAPSVNVTLTKAVSLKPPEEADFVAQANQIGSGNLDQAKQITTDQLSPFSSQNIEQVQLPNETKSAKHEPFKNQVIATYNESSKAPSLDADTQPVQHKAGEDILDIENISREIASLNAKLDRQRQQYAKRPRERVLTAVSAKTSRDAAYLNQWTRKIEVVGNQNFPEEAIIKRITGSLRLQAIVKWDGSLIHAKILQTSGHRILDDAALQIVHQSAPFSAFPQEIRKNTDQLVIIRTWFFDVSGLTTSN